MSRTKHLRPSKDSKRVRDLRAEAQTLADALAVAEGAALKIQEERDGLRAEMLEIAIAVGLTHDADDRAQQPASTPELLAEIRRQREGGRLLEAWRDWCAAWLLRAFNGITREGWEEGMSRRETLGALSDVLSNLNCNPIDDWEQQVEAKRLLEWEVPYSPPSVRP